MRSAPVAAFVTLAASWMTVPATGLSIPSGRMMIASRLPSGSTSIWRTVSPSPYTSDDSEGVAASSRVYHVVPSVDEVNDEAPA